MNAPRVTLLVWRVPPRRLPQVLWRMAADRGRLRRNPSVQFAKLLGTGQGSQFGPTRADPTRWATLLVHDEHADPVQTPVGQAWQALSSAYCRLDLAPLSSRGRWAGQEPFHPADPVGRPREGMVLAITRARLRPSRAVTFWRAIGDVAPAARRAPGLLATFGIGEAPIGWQGTVSLWRDARDLVEFAYRHPDHRKAIEQTPTQQWYAEELFARFAVIELAGDRTVLGWSAAPGNTEPHRNTDPPPDQERTSP